MALNVLSCSGVGGQLGRESRVDRRRGAAAERGERGAGRPGRSRRRDDRGGAEGVEQFAGGRRLDRLEGVHPVRRPGHVPDGGRHHYHVRHHHLLLLHPQHPAAAAQAAKEVAEDKNGSL